MSVPNIPGNNQQTTTTTTTMSSSNSQQNVNPSGQLPQVQNVGVDRTAEISTAADRAFQGLQSNQHLQQSQSPVQQTSLSSSEENRLISRLNELRNELKYPSGYPFNFNPRSICEVFEIFHSLGKDHTSCVKFWLDIAISVPRDTRRDFLCMEGSQIRGSIREAFGDRVHAEQGSYAEITELFNLINQQADREDQALIEVFQNLAHDSNRSSSSGVQQQPPRSSFFSADYDDSGVYDDMPGLEPEVIDENGNFISETPESNFFSADYDDSGVYDDMPGLEPGVIDENGNFISETPESNPSQPIENPPQGPFAVAPFAVQSFDIPMITGVEYLSYPEILVCLRVCRVWNRMMHNSMVWEIMYRRYNLRHRGAEDWNARTFRSYYLRSYYLEPPIPNSNSPSSSVYSEDSDENMPSITFLRALANLFFASDDSDDSDSTFDWEPPPITNIISNPTSIPANNPNPSYYGYGANAPSSAMPGPDFAQYITKFRKEAVLDETLQSFDTSALEADEDVKDKIACWLQKLTGSKDYKNEQTRPLLCTSVLSCLYFATQNREFLNTTLPEVFSQAVGSCVDDAAFTVNELELKKKIAEASDTSLGYFVALLKGGHKVAVLKEFGSRFIASKGYVDGVSVQLGLQVKLKDVLGLPVDCQDLKYYYASGLNEADLVKAEKEVNEAAKNIDDIANYFLIEKTWTNRLKKEFSKELNAASKDISDKMDVLDELSGKIKENEYKNQADLLKNQYEILEAQWLRKKTLELLKSL